MTGRIIEKISDDTFEVFLINPPNGLDYFQIVKRASSPLLDGHCGYHQHQHFEKEQYVELRILNNEDSSLLLCECIPFN